jgi:Tfp pilus assembly protein PilF
LRLEPKSLVPKKWCAPLGEPRCCRDRRKAAIELQPTADLAAYDSYVRAKALLAVSSDARQGTYLYQSAHLLEQAIAHDPTFLLAYCKLAYVHIQFYYQGFDHSGRRLAQANEAVRKALELGPDRGEAHLAAAWVPAALRERRAGQHHPV